MTELEQQLTARVAELENAFTKIKDRFDDKQRLHREDCFAYQVTAEVLNRQPAASLLMLKAEGLRELAATGRMPHGGDRLFTVSDLLTEADRIDMESDHDMS